MACDDEVIPSQERIEAAADQADLEEVYNTERHLLYVACTRARDFLLVTGVRRFPNSSKTWRANASRPQRKEQLNVRHAGCSGSESLR